MTLWGIEVALCAWLGVRCAPSLLPFALSFKTLCRFSKASRHLVLYPWGEASIWKGREYRDFDRYSLLLSGCPPKSGPASLGSPVNLPFIFCGWKGLNEEWLTIKLILFKILFWASLQHKTSFLSESAFSTLFDGRNSVILKAALLRNG